MYQTHLHNYRASTPGLRQNQRIHQKLYSKYQKINNKFTNTFIKEVDIRAIKGVIIPMFIFLVESIIIGISIYFISIKRVGIEHLIMIISYYSILNEKIREVLYYSEDLRTINVNINRVEKLNEFVTGKSLSFGSNKKDNIKGIIEFKNVSFGYNKELILKDISFRILPNTVTAIVGKSGSGKSTIYNLLLRFCKPKKGIIKMDNINIINYDTDIYLRNISAVSQDAYIFGDTIKNNLSLIEPDLNKMKEACMRAHIHDFIMTLPKGYDTVLADNASSLSGGQKQRLAIARTLLKKSEIILFDEVTSALDTALRKEITNEIYDLKKDHTIIMISHKIEEIIKADQIVLLDNGVVVGNGTHEELLNNRHYRKIFDLD
jgi:ABC-type multidrug transport system fused ATPase/permease subunit